MKLNCKRSERTCADGAMSFKLMILMTTAFAALGLTLRAADPSWWATRGAVNSSLTRNDYAAFNEGQLKQFTAKAVQEMNTNLPGGAGTTLNSLVLGWQQDYATNGYGSSNPKPTDFQAIKEGQLKYIASLVDAPLIASGYMTSTPTWLHTNSLVDTHMAKVGQLKQVFAFEIGVPQSPANLAVILSGNQAALTWSEAVISVQTFTIQYSADGGTTWSNLTTVTGNQTSATVTSLTLGADYKFRAVASNVAGSSAPSTSDAAPLITLVTPSGATLVP